MSERGWWGLVALGVLLGAAIGGVVGYSVGQGGSVEPSASVTVQAAEQDVPDFADADICTVSDIAQALSVFGSNSLYPVDAATVAQLRKAGALFDRATDFAKDPALVAALDSLSEVSLSVEEGETYEFAPYEEFADACSGLDTD